MQGIRRMLAVLVAACLCAVLAPSVMAQPLPQAHFARASTLGPVVPGGLPADNATRARSIFLGRANNDPGLAAKMASMSGASSFNASDFRALGTTAPPVPPTAASMAAAACSPPRTHRSAMRIPRCWS
jgi:hypothetical protein